MFSILPPDIKRLIIANMTSKQLRITKITNPELSPYITYNIVNEAINRGFPRLEARTFRIGDNRFFRKFESLDYWQFRPKCDDYINNYYNNKHIVKGDIVIVSVLRLHHMKIRFIYNGIDYLEIEYYKNVIPYIKDIPIGYWPEKYSFYLDFRLIVNKKYEDCMLFNDELDMLENAVTMTFEINGKEYHIDAFQDYDFNDTVSNLERKLKSIEFGKVKVSGNYILLDL
jgi:hypothetical protein